MPMTLGEMLINAKQVRRFLTDDKDKWAFNLQDAVKTMDQIIEYLDEIADLETVIAEINAIKRRD